MLFASKAAVDDLHLDWICFCATDKFSAAKTQVLIHGNLRNVAVTICCGGNIDRNEHNMVPIGMSCFPFFFCHARSLHVGLFFVLTIRDKTTDVFKCVTIEYVVEEGGVGLL